MSVVYVALPVALLLGAAGMYACIRCIWDGQYEDLDSPAVRILIDEPKALPGTSELLQK